MLKSVHRLEKVNELFDLRVAKNCNFFYDSAWFKTC